MTLAGTHSESAQRGPQSRLLLELQQESACEGHGILTSLQDSMVSGSLMRRFRMKLREDTLSLMADHGRLGSRMSAGSLLAMATVRAAQELWVCLSH
jgi:hypothetical protein